MKLAGQLLLSLSCSLSTVYCMQEVPVKLNADDSLYSLPLCVVQKSNTMYEKCLWRDTLKISAKQPIVVYNVSSKQLGLFYRASYTIEENFPDFLKTLNLKQQKRLIAAAGENALNSPEITALLAQEYLLPDIVQNRIIPHMRQNKMTQYMLNKMIKHNIDNSSLEMKLLWQQNKLHLCSNGIVYNILDCFDAHSQLYTTSLGAQIQLLDLDDLNNTMITHMRKKVGPYEYHITSANESSGIFHIWRLLNEQVIEKKELTLTDPILASLCSFDGNFIAICTMGENKNSIVLLALDHESDNMISKEIKCTDSLSHCVDMQFNNSSTAFFALAYDNDAYKSQLLIYDLCTHQEKIILFDELCFIAPTISFDSKRIIVSHVNQDDINTLSVWDISSLQNPIKLETINIADLAREVAFYYKEKDEITTTNDKAFAVTIQYDRNSYNAVIQLNNGNMIFLEEKSTDNIITRTSINSNIYSFQKYITNTCLLYTSDNRFIISHCTVNPIREKTYPYVTLWDNLSKKLIAVRSHVSNTMEREPIIVMSSDECSFIINAGKIADYWIPYTLFTPDDKATGIWMNSKHTLFSLYTIRRLYQAYKNKEEVITHENDALDMFLKSLPTTPHNIQQCVKTYLMVAYKKNRGWHS